MFASRFQFSAILVATFVVAGCSKRTESPLAKAESTQTPNLESQRQLRTTASAPTDLAPTNPDSANPTESKPKAAQSEVQERIADRLASQQMLEATLGKHLEPVAIEYLAGARDLTFDERLAWGILMVSHEDPDKGFVTSVLRLLELSNESTSSEDVQAFIKRRARMAALITPEQHQSSVNFAIALNSSFTFTMATDIVKVVSIMEASTSADLKRSKTKVKELFCEAFTSNPGFVAVFSKVEVTTADYKAEEQKMSVESVKEKLVKAKKGLRK